MKVSIIILMATLISSVSMINTAVHANDKKDLSKVEKLEGIKAKGAKIIQINPDSMGLPKKTLPGTQYITFEKWKKMKKIPKTGLFLVDMQTIPKELPTLLKKQKYTLSKKGKLLDEKGSPIAIFIKPAYFEIQSNKKKLTSDNNFIDWFIPQAQAGNPHPFRCYSERGWSIYRGGYCRSYEARTYAHAYGPDNNNRCSKWSPHTRIDYIETRVSIGVLNDRDSCRNCDVGSSRQIWDIGCLWPAHDRAGGTHFLHLKDGRIEVTRAATWTH